ncbi:MAG: hypothetical protein PHC78_02555 [Verrucomicrobiota bacterium]|nr:hypothetical protein [Verrucomicrobiota bacterium]
MDTNADNLHADRDFALDAWNRMGKQLRQATADGGGPWLTPPIPHLPRVVSPLGFSLFARFVSAPEGLPSVIRTLGFEPAPTEELKPLLVHIGGRCLLDLSRLPLLFGLPAGEGEYDQDLLRAEPDAVFRHPEAALGAEDGRHWWQAHRRMSRIAEELPLRIQGSSLPLFREWLQAQAASGFGHTSERVLAETWREMVQQVWFWMGTDLVLIQCIMGTLAEEIRAFVWDRSGPHELASVLETVLVSSPDSVAAQRASALFRLGKNRLSREDFLDAFGHYGSSPWEISTGRWHESTDTLSAAVEEALAAGDPQARLLAMQGDAERLEAELTAGMGRRTRAGFERALDFWRRYDSLFQEVEDAILRGLGQMRALALEMGARTELEGNIFYMTESEMLGAVESSIPVWKECDARKQRLLLEQQLPVPKWIGDEELSFWDERVEPSVGEQDAIGGGTLRDMKVEPGLAPPWIDRLERSSLRYGWAAGALWLLILGGILIGLPLLGGAGFGRLLRESIASIAHASGNFAIAVAAGVIMALLLMACQRLLPAAGRWAALRERTRILDAEARDLPEAAPRRKRLLALNTEASKRLMRGRLSGFLLGWGAIALVCTCVVQLFDPTPEWGANSIAIVTVTASGDLEGNLRLVSGEGVALPEGDDGLRVLRPIRGALERQLARWRAPDPARVSEPDWPLPPEALLQELSTVVAAPAELAVRTVHWNLEAEEGWQDVEAEVRLDDQRIAVLALGDLASRAEAGSTEREGGQAGSISGELPGILDVTARFYGGRADNPNVAGVFDLGSGAGWLIGFLLGFLGCFLPVRSLLRFP